MERKLGQLLPCDDAQAVRVVSREVRGPLTGPAQGDDDPLPGPLEVEVAEVAVRGSATGRGDALARVGRERRLQRLVVVRLAGASDVVVQEELALLATLETSIKTLETLDDRRVGVPAIPEVHGPLHDGEVAVLDADATNLKARLGVAVGTRSACPAVVQRLTRLCEAPAGQ